MIQTGRFRRVTQTPSSPPPPNVPGDTKDWTWVLTRVCSECSFDVRSVPRERIGGSLREVAIAWDEVLAGSTDTLRRRPRYGVWSPLEYGAHVNDVLALYAERLDLMMTEDGPHYPDWDQDVTAVEKRYDLADPRALRAELAANADRLASGFEAVAGAAWDRTGFRSDGAAFTVESFSRYLLHDPVHHLWDVGVTFVSEDGHVD